MSSPTSLSGYLAFENTGLPQVNINNTSNDFNRIGCIIQKTAVTSLVQVNKDYTKNPALVTPIALVPYKLIFWKAVEKEFEDDDNPIVLDDTKLLYYYTKAWCNNINYLLSAKVTKTEPIIFLKDDIKTYTTANWEKFNEDNIYGTVDSNDTFYENMYTPTENWMNLFGWTVSSVCSEESDNTTEETPNTINTNPSADNISDEELSDFKEKINEYSNILTQLNNIFYNLKPSDQKELTQLNEEIPIIIEKSKDISNIKSEFISNTNIIFQNINNLYESNKDNINNYLL